MKCNQHQNSQQTGAKVDKESQFQGANLLFICSKLAASVISVGDFTIRINEFGKTWAYLNARWGTQVLLFERYKIQFKESVALETLATAAAASPLKL